MSEATLTSKCQITIPAELRDQMRLVPGQQVVFTQLQDGTVVMRAKKRSIQDLKGMLKPKSKKIKVTVDQMQIGRR
jgi:antitoxin PrlF